MATLPLAVDIADMAMRRERVQGRFDLEAAALELRLRHPDAAATPKDIADALRDLTCWSWAKGQAGR